MISGKKLLTLIPIIPLLYSANKAYSLEDVYRAIKLVETGKGTGINVIGDNGKSYGPYQISKAYFIDSGVKGTWEQCLTDKAFSEKVMLQYWKRYVPDALDPINPEILARIHNLGPNWKNKQQLGNIYWNKVKREI